MTIELNHTGLLAVGWRNHPQLWVAVPMDCKDSIREFIAAVADIKPLRTPAQIETVLVKRLSHFYDQRFSLPTARFGQTNFWENTNYFMEVTSSMISKGFVNNTRLMQDIQACVTRALSRYNQWVYICAN